MSEEQNRKPSHNWFHFPILLSVSTLCLYWYWHLPAPNKAVLWLGGMAALMALVEMRPLHKALYFVLIIALIFTENRAIDKDRRDFADAEANRRKVEDGQFSDIGSSITANVNNLLADSDKKFRETVREESSHFNATMRRSDALTEGIAETINAETGGDSFCYYELSGGVISDAGVDLIGEARGKYPLSDVSARIAETDNERVLSVVNQKVGNLGVTEIPLGVSLAAEPIHVPFTAPPDKENLDIYFSGKNGFWAQFISFRKVKGKWLMATIVQRRVPIRHSSKTKAVVLLRRVPDGFPIDTVSPYWKTIDKLPVAH